MKVTDIRMVSNGFVIQDEWQNEYIAKTLLESAQIAGEIAPASAQANNTYTLYDAYHGKANLATVRDLAANGRRIDAIKLLRECFVPRLGLREAKELIEELCA